MNDFRLIEQKLQAFIRKYYFNAILRGAIAFVAIGLAYFLLTLSFEYFFWLGTLLRSILFWVFISVELALFLRFIALPLARLLKLSKGIDYFQASEMIGKHFPEVDDKLVNILQLKQNKADSDLILASINQKSKELKPVPFSIAVNFKSNLKYLKYAAIPVAVILIIYISGNSSFFSDSYSRVVHYDTEFTPPAPFEFQILNGTLTTQEDQNFTLQVQTAGRVVPGEAKITYKGKTYVLEQVQPGVFRHEFDRRQEDLDFRLQANDVKSKSYHLDVVKVPSLVDFKMHLDYPEYIGKTDETIKGTGNTSVPEGTEIKWDIKAENTDKIAIKWPDTTQQMTETAKGFSWKRQLFKTLPYALSTSNENLRDYEKLNYEIKLIPDENPEIEVEKKQDSVEEDVDYFFGRLSDDYGLRKLEIVYQPEKNARAAKRKSIAINRSNFDEFVYAFPGELDLEAGTPYKFYFRVWDNDAVNGSKAARSQSFHYRKMTAEEKQDKQLQNQQEAIQGMDKSLKEMRKSKKDWEDLDQMRKEKKQLDYNDKRELKQFMQEQKRQQKKMQQYSKKMKKNLEKFKSKEDAEQRKEQLEDRLERSEEQSEKNKKLLDELKKYEDKIEKDQLNKDLDEIKKQSESQRKNLEQMLELTKRFYVEEKARKLNEKLEDLAEEQKEQSEKGKNNTAEEQEKLNDKFEDLQEELDSLENDNQDLKAPMDLNRDTEKEESAAEDQQEATEGLKQEEKQENPDNSEEEQKTEGEEGQKDSESDETKEGQKSSEQQKGSRQSGAQKKQQSAAEKMKQMAQQMQMAMQQSGQQQQAEDAEMLRQVLENLITYSFQQEDLMDDFQDINSKSSDFPEKLRYQNTLKENFQHINDSLYALATRNPMIGEKVTQKLTDIEFNIDKALERLAQNNMRKGRASQQYIFKGANDLANLLDESLQQMQSMMQSSGKGKGQKGKSGKQGNQQGRGFQLPDIIKKQGELSKKGKGKKKGKQPGKKPGDQGKSGEKGKSGKKAGQKPGGKSSGKGKKGEQGKGGKSGKGQKSGCKGQEGQNQDEQMSGEVYEIYKQQQRLRMELEDMLKKSGLKEKQRRLLNDMENVEQNLLRHGVTEQTENQMLRVKEQLMKLDNAAMKQGKKNERKSESNTEEYDNETQMNLEKAKDYFNTTEILNRKNLPLRQQFKKKVEQYFQTSND